MINNIIFVLYLYEIEQLLLQLMPVYFPFVPDMYTQVELSGVTIYKYHIENQSKLLTL